MRRPLLIGGVYFLLFALLFFALMYGAARFGTIGGAFRSGEQIALVRIDGVILDSEPTTDLLRRYREDEGVKAILLRIDSPGGGVVPSQEIYDEVRALKGVKKVVTSMGTVAASGGYYIASASDKIIANPGTLTGSIGVIMEMPNVESLLEKVGVESVVIKSGKNKDVGSPFRKMQPEERALLQEVLDDVHAQFIDAVAEGRALDPEAVRLLADGRIFTGRQAMALGLVDELGSLQDAIQTTAEMVGIEGEPDVIESEEPYIFEMIKSRFWNWSAPRLPFRLSYLLAF
jgi:protease-4